MAFIDNKHTQVLFDHNMSEAEEIIRNVKNIIATPKGSMPGTRGFGMSQDAVDYPAPIAQNMIAVELSDELEEWEPRVDVAEVNIIVSEDGSAMYPVITLTEGEETEDEI